MIRALRLRRAVLQPADLLSDWTAAGVLSEELLPLLQADRGLADWRTRDTGADECWTVVRSSQSLHLLERSTLGSDQGQTWTSFWHTDLLRTTSLLSGVINSLDSLTDLASYWLAGGCGADNLPV